MIISLGSIRQELGLAGARGREIPHKWFLVGWIICYITDKNLNDVSLIKIMIISRKTVRSTAAENSPQLQALGFGHHGVSLKISI